MKRLMTMISLALTIVALASNVFAAGCTGKVTKVEGEKVTVTLDGAAPVWAKKGATVTALGGAPKVIAVHGKEVTLKMNKAKAAKVKVDSSVTLSKSDGEMQGC